MAVDVIHINGLPIRLQGCFDRVVQDASGQTVAEKEVAIIIRGGMANKQFIQLISKDKVRLDFEDGPRSVSMIARIMNHSAVVSGEGEGAINRHDLTFREDPESYQRRMAERAAEAPIAVAAPVRKTSAPAAPVIEDISQVTIGTSVSQWGDALRQLKSDAPRPRVTEMPLTQIELTAVDSVLTNLRIDALIEQLDAAGIVRREAVDERFRALIESRFVAEAIPLVGEAIARRALREMDE